MNRNKADYNWAVDSKKFDPAEIDTNCELMNKNSSSISMTKAYP